MDAEKGFRNTMKRRNRFLILLAGSLFLSVNICPAAQEQAEAEVQNVQDPFSEKAKDSHARYKDPDHFGWNADERDREHGKEHREHFRGNHQGMDKREFTPGVTVEKNEGSPTGYLVTFVYENADAKEVELCGSFEFHLDDGTRGDWPDVYYSPYEWEDGMFAAGHESYSFDMEKLKDSDYWILELPLSGGLYQYVYYVDGSEERTMDPTNPGLSSGLENGGWYPRSCFYVPCDQEKQERSMDYSFLEPLPEEESGTVLFDQYDDLFGNPASLGIYLPAGYDENREEPYKVLYLMHGHGGDETYWLGGGKAGVLFDHLILEGACDPTILVAMNYSAYAVSEDDDTDFITDEWSISYNMIHENLMDYVIPFVEDNYNAGTDSCDRAMAGFSMGGMLTTYFLYYEADKFDYFGAFSGGEPRVDFETLDYDSIRRPFLMIGGGIYDFGYTYDELGFDYDWTTCGYSEILDRNEISYEFYEVNGAHDWFTWDQLLYIFGKKYLWKS